MPGRPIAEAKAGKEYLYQLSGRVIEGAMRVHTQLGPGLLEDAYEACLCRALSTDGIGFETQREVAMPLGGLDLDCGFRLDLLVEGCMVVEVKAVAHLQPVHVSQLRSCLKVANYPCGLLINFNTSRLHEGIHQVFSGLPSRPFSPSPPSFQKKPPHESH